MLALFLLRPGPGPNMGNTRSKWMVDDEIYGNVRLEMRGFKSLP